MDIKCIKRFVIVRIKIFTIVFVSARPLVELHVTEMSVIVRVPHFGSARPAGKFHKFPPWQQFSPGVWHSILSSELEWTSKQKDTSSSYPQLCPKQVIFNFPECKIISYSNAVAISTKISSKLKPFHKCDSFIKKQSSLEEFCCNLNLASFTLVFSKKAKSYLKRK